MTEIAYLQHVSKIYDNGIQALSDVSIGLEKGQCTALLGPNGAGKTTTVKILTGLLKSNSGKAWIDSKKKVGLALQDIGLWPELTVAETLTFVGKLYQMSPQASLASRSQLLETLELKGQRDIQVQALSEGLKRRVNLACALIHDPDILILDEPSLGLDVHSRALLWTFLERLLEHRTVTLLLSTHDLKEAERLSQRVAILNEGKLLAFGPIREIKSMHEDSLIHEGTTPTLENIFLMLTTR